MIDAVRNWFRRNAYGVFTLRALVALGSAAVSVALSYLPWDTALQAIWVVVSTTFMASVVLRQRLNETDDARYRRLFQSRFDYLQQADPEALTTVFAENIRGRVLGWFHSEYGVAVSQVPTIDAVDSLARNGDAPGQLIFRTGVELGQWLEQSRNDPDKVASLEARMQKFVRDNEPLMGQLVAPGVYLRHIRVGEQRPVGVHMFHPESRLLLTVEYYEKGSNRHALALSAKSSLFANGGDDAWESFRDNVYAEFPDFRPASGGSGPQRKEVPYFVGSIVDEVVPDDTALSKHLVRLMEKLPGSPSDSVPPEPEDRAAADRELSGGERTSDETDGTIQEMHELRRADGSIARAGVIDSHGKKATFDAESLAPGVRWADLFAAWKQNNNRLEVFYVDIGPGVGGTRMADRVRRA